MTNMNHEQRMEVTRGVMNMLDAWKLSSRDIITLLDLPDSVRSRNVGRFRKDLPFPDEPQVMKRIDYLLRISDALRTYFPRNSQMRSLWMRKANRHFHRQAPLARMVEGGENGLVSVLTHLDCTYAWDMTGSKATYRH